MPSPRLSSKNYHKIGLPHVIEIEIQNETHQSELRLKVMSVPRIGEGIRLKEPDSSWASYDVLDVWYQQADYGEVWVPYIHVRMTPADAAALHAAPAPVASVNRAQAMPIEEFLAKFEGPREHETTRISLDMSEEG